MQVIITISLYSQLTSEQDSTKHNSKHGENVNLLHKFISISIVKKFEEDLHLPGMHLGLFYEMNFRR